MGFLFPTPSSFKQWQIKSNPTHFYFYLHKTMRSESHNGNKSIRITFSSHALLFFFCCIKIFLSPVKRSRLCRFIRNIHKNEAHIKKFHVKNENLYSVHSFSALHKPSLGFTYISMLLCQLLGEVCGTDFVRDSHNNSPSIRCGTFFIKL